MTRIHLVRFVAVSVAAIIGLAACSSDSDKTTVEDLSTIDVSLPPGVVVPGLTDDCQALYLQFITAMTSAFAPPGAIDYTQVFGDVSAAVPADLQDELTLLSTAFQEYGEIVAANNNDMSSPDVQAAIQALNTPEISAASTTVQAYFDETCPAAP
jgi:hypothetical protein